jgi:hypothetical protein
VVDGGEPAEEAGTLLPDLPEPVDPTLRLRGVDVDGYCRLSR